MASVEIGGLTEEEKEMMDTLADEADMSTSQWARYRLRAGHRLWDAGGNFDIKEVQQRLDLETPEETDEESVSPTGRIRQVIKRNLSTDRGMDQDEIEDLITEEAISEALGELIDEGEIEYSPRKGGYVRI